MGGVKRPYNSARRDEQARQTRRAILAAAGRLFVQRGYGSTTLQEIADEAGVAVQTVYASFGKKTTVLEQLLDVSIAGDDAAVAVNDREWMQDVFTHPDPRARLQAYAAAVTAIHERAGDIFIVVRSAAAADSGLVALAVATEQRRRSGATSIVEALDAIGALRAELSVEEAVDVLWTLNSPDVHRLLVRESGWPPERFQAWLASMFIAALLAAAPRPAG